MTELTLEKKEKELADLQAIKEKQKYLAQLKAEKEWRLTHSAIRYYCVRPDRSYRGPNPIQMQFHCDDHAGRIMSAANRSGKSTAGINEDVAHSLGYRPWLPETDPHRKINIQVPNKGLICGETFGEQIDKVLVPKLLGDPESRTPGALPTQELAQAVKNQQGIINYIRLKNGSEIFLQSYDQKVDLFESADYAWAHLDEPPPRPIFVAIQRGLADRVGRWWITMTPLKEPWIYDELFSRPDVRVFYGNIEDNVGYGLTQAGIDQFAASLTEDEKEARLRGKYFHLTGLVYKVYGSIHRIKRFEIPPSWPMWMHLDTHPRTPHHAIWLTIGPNGNKYVCGELRNSDPTNRVRAMGDGLLTYEKVMFNKTHPRRIDDVVRLIDPSASAPNPVDGLSIWDAFADMGIRCRAGSKNRDSGILLTQAALQHDVEKGVYPDLYFFDDLPGIHYEMTHYIWEDWQRKTQQYRTEKQVPRDKDDHFIEGLHRIMIDNPAYETLETDTSDEEYRQQAVGSSSITGY